VLGREGKFEAADRLIGEPSLGLLGDVCGMIAENQPDRRVGRIGGVDELEEFDEFAAAVDAVDGRQLFSTNAPDHQYQARVLHERATNPGAPDR